VTKKLVKRPTVKASVPRLARRPAGYVEWLAEVKDRVRTAQQRASLAVNHELLRLYWGIGRDILDRQVAGTWGEGIVDQVAADLRVEFPSMKGFSRSNVMYMRAFAQAWPGPEFVQQPVGQIPWGHNLVLLTKLKDRNARLAYAASALEHGWSRAVLVHHIEARTVERRGKALTNFGQHLPKPHSDLARESLKDPYRFDFLGVGEESDERALEDALVSHMTKFLLELGAGFAFVGRQVHLEVGGDDFFIDLLFYHLKLHCYVVIELKAVPFKPAHTGQLSFYLADIYGGNPGRVPIPSRDAPLPAKRGRTQAGRGAAKEPESNLPSVEQIERELGEVMGA
jgi:predicted nuclease of restriction endonuclease-like (RecB) superfamily